MKLILCTFLSKNYDLFPYSCGLLSSYLLQSPEKNIRDVDCKIFSFAHDEQITVACERICSLNPDIVGLSCYVMNFLQTIRLIEAIKCRLPTTRIVVGGPHVSEKVIELKQLLDKSKIDFLVVGEGEEPLTNIIRNSVQNTLSNLPKVIFGQPIELDSLPNPYAIEFSMLETIKKTGIAILEGGRGCPYKCIYCGESYSKPRLRSIEKLKADLRFVYQHGARHIFFLDPNFNQNSYRMKELLCFISKELPDLKFNIEIKADILTDRDIEALNFEMIEIEVGLQTTNIKTLKRIRRPEKLEKLWPNIRKLTNRGIRVTVNTIYGLPGETFRDWLRTIDDIYSETTAIISSTCLKLLPNTELYQNRNLYGYEYDNSDMFRAIQSHAMNAAEFLRAERLSKLLAFFHIGGNPLPIQLRELVNNQFSDSLSNFLTSFERGEFNLTKNGGIRVN